jgi:DNA-binding response OmpR family regulator
MSGDRVRAFQQRAHPAVPKVLRAAGLELDVSRHTVRVGGAFVNLTSKEFEVLKTLMETKGGVVTRDFLWERIWECPRGPVADSRTIDVHIHRLRQKLGPEGSRILTVKNVGYRFDVSLEWIRFGA